MVYIIDKDDLHELISYTILETLLESDAMKHLTVKQEEELFKRIYKRANNLMTAYE